MAAPLSISTAAHRSSPTTASSISPVGADALSSAARRAIALESVAEARRMVKVVGVIDLSRG
jgi:hypothetical protein